MKQENEPAARSSGKTPDSNTAGRRGEATPVARAKPGEVTVNFHSAEFNRVDDLNDCTGNYRSFEPLDGVVTAHERHQTELRLRRGAADLHREGPAHPARSEVESDEALEVPAPLTVTSEGRTLIIDTDAERAVTCGKTLRDHRLDCTLLVTGSTRPKASPSSLGRSRILHVDSVSVNGAFGGFSAKVTVGGSEKPLAEWVDDGAIFDLVLDLQPAISFTGGRPPIGYYAPGPSPAALGEALAELPEMRGQFKKPQFVAYYKNRCFHGRSRNHDCRRCMEICPVGAIRSVEGAVFLNHHLCQGCGGCALACPADAFRVVQPSQEELLRSLQSTLESPSAGGASPISLIISDLTSAAGNGGAGSDERDGNRRICFEVGQIAHVRLGLLLAALAYGASEVLMGWNPQNSPATIRGAVGQQVGMAQAILQGLGLGEERIRFLGSFPEDTDLAKRAPRLASISERANDPPRAPAIFSTGLDGRALVRQTAQYLRDRSGSQQPWLPLPVGSPFGTLAVNSAKCTFCMACAGACPSGALASGGSAPRLIFQESKCHQCGLCQETCPEGAIQLVPRLLLDPRAAEGQAVLREAEPFRCVECGVPFAPPAMIDRVKEKLAGHWMYGNERQLRRLQMCRTCRTRDALTSSEMESWNR